MEFDAANYDEAISLADAILGNARAIDDVFKNIDSIMNQMYSPGGAWESAGANQAEQAFQSDFHSRFEPFVKNVEDTNKYIHTTVENYKSTDSSSTSKVTSV